MASGKFTNLTWDLSRTLPELTKPRTDLIALFILSILKVGTVNLLKISLAMGSSAQAKSNYRRLQRFIDQVNWCFMSLTPLILRWAGIASPMTLVLDRTNWKLGKANINILCICVVHGFRYRNDDGKSENLIITSFTSATKVSEVCSKRWYIEVMFKNFRTNGFNMEDTHVTNQNRLATLFGLFTLGYICAINAGKIIMKEKPELFRIAKNGRPKISIFKTGLDELLNVLLNGLTKIFNQIFKFLSCA